MHTDLKEESGGLYVIVENIADKCFFRYCHCLGFLSCIKYFFNFVNKIHVAPPKSVVYKLYTSCIQNVYTGKDSIGKDSIGKDRLGKDSVVTPKDRASNLSNYNHLKETEKDEYITYIVNHTELDDAVCLWMQYKDEKKPHSQNHYADTGMVSLLKKIYKMALDYGVAPVIDPIEMSMGNNYQGIVWDRMQKQTKSQTFILKQTL